MTSTAAKIPSMRTQTGGRLPSTPRPPLPLRAIELSSSDLESIGCSPPSGRRLAPPPPLRACRSAARHGTQTGVHEAAPSGSRRQVHTIPLSSVDLELSRADLEATESCEHRTPPPLPQAETTETRAKIQSVGRESSMQDRRVGSLGRLAAMTVVCVVFAVGVITFLYFSEPQTASSLETAGGEASFLALNQPQPVSVPVPVVRAHHTTAGPPLNPHARPRTTNGNVVSVNQKKKTMLAALAPTPGKKLAYSKVADHSLAPSKK